MVFLGSFAKSAVAAAALCAAGAAQATLYTYVITGTVDAQNSYDLEYLFGGDLTGATFTATYVLDDALPTAAYHYDVSGSSANGGGMFLAGTTPPLTATLTIDGHSATVPQGDRQQSPVIDPVTGDGYGPTENEQDQGSAVKDAASRTLSLGANYSDDYSCCAPVTYYGTGVASGLFFDLTGDGLTDADFRQTGLFALAPTSSGFFYDTRSYTDRQGQSVNFTNVSLLAQQLTVTSDVPEPAAWAMLAIGFGAIGTVVRRRPSRAMRGA